ncbi:tyrosine-type recombinase/integrase [Acinetobacter larvae]|nr:integrase family protein [Acinetobacter larvae]
MPHEKLTKTFIDSIDLSPTKQILYRDTVTIGFGICVGGVKSYFVEKKMPNGKPKRKVIGKHGVYTLEQARTIAKQLLIDMDNGIDPVEEKRKAKADTIAQDNLEKSIPSLFEAFENYKANKELAERTLLSYTNCIENYFVDWKDLKITKLTEKMVRDKHKIISDSTSGKAQANLSMKLLSALFNYSKKYYIDDSGKNIITSDNPVKILYELKSWNKVKRRKTYIRADQQSDWAMAVATTQWVGHQNNDMFAYTNLDFLFLIALTGFRRDEAERIEWSKVDLKYGTITVTDTKNGEDLTLPIGDTLLHILKERKKRSTSKYVFPGRNADSHLTDRRIARAKVAEKSGITFTYHDLRRTFSSIANSLAIGSYTIKRLINHTVEDNSHDVTDGYVQVPFDDLRKAMNMIEDVVLPEQVKVLIENRLYIKDGETRNAQQYWDDHVNKLVASFG